MEPNQIQFIYQPAPGEAPDPNSRRLAHVHAINVANRREQGIRNRALANFRVMTPMEFSQTEGKKSNVCQVFELMVRKCADDRLTLNYQRKKSDSHQDTSRNEQPSIAPRTALSASKQESSLNFQGHRAPLFSTPSTPRFESIEGIPVSCTRIDYLMNSNAFRRAAEPLFATDSDAQFSVSAIFPTGFQDPAFLNALLYSTVSALNKGEVTAEGLMLKGQAIRFLNNKISSPNILITDACVGTVMILTGVEYRAYNRPAHEAHMQGLVQMMKFDTFGRFSTKELIERGLFWQDLNGAVMTGSKRYFTHDTFQQMHWRRSAPDDSLAYKLPLGFVLRSEILTTNLITSLEDINALQKMTKTRADSQSKLLSFGEINNIQASIESRLELQSGETRAFGPITECCRLAAYLCCYNVSTETWNGQIIPLHISKQLEELLSASWGDFTVWKDHVDLLFWLLFTGMAAAFEEDVSLQSRYLALTHELISAFDILCNSLEKAEGILIDFLWSETWFGRPWQRVWSEVSPSW